MPRAPPSRSVREDREPLKFVLRRQIPLSCLANRFARIRMGLPLRRRTVSLPVTASAGMPSSAVERGFKYAKAAGLCIKGVSVSSAIASFSRKAAHAGCAGAPKHGPKCPAPGPYRAPRTGRKCLCHKGFRTPPWSGSGAQQPGFVNLDLAGFQSHLFPVPGQVIGPLAVDLDGRIGRRAPGSGRR